MDSFNFLVTTIRGFEDRAASELREVLRAQLKTAAEVKKAEPGGVLMMSIDIPSKQLLEKVQETIKMQPWLLGQVQRIIPIHKTVKTEIGEIVQAVEELARSIRKKETFRITVERRHTDLPTHEIIKKSAARIDRRVDLNDPNWVVLIEILGKLTGVSVLRPDDVLSTTKYRRGL